MNAQSSDVREVSTTAEVTAFLEGEDIAETSAENGDGVARTPTLVVERVAPNGTVIKTVEIYGNETVCVVQGNVTNTTAGG